ncbi:phosphopantetheine adenylyltransferase [Pseudoduganella lurida]|uniref:Phosphopantetheine adenylyltransferase n=1 Tax=Pseudoduganella lurida TaxID=1036180 RepID=A0A562QZ93_9BURK|nr:pantetheine-phosphate adenylyltransferase [Pseudoduganella lurida]TWI62138.1 phosphopantetheine adenylyltransferase [Pseudoduganella lurida]
MKKIGFSGTLDPITNGHMWVIGEARSIADEVIVFLSQNASKEPRFSAEERRAIVLESCAERHWDNVQVVIVKSDYTARVARRHGVDYLIRGIRTTADFDYENLIQQTNVEVIGGAKTLFVMPPRDLGSVSSSFVKALEGPVGWNWTTKKFVPGPAYRAWILRWLHQEWQSLFGTTQTGNATRPNTSEWFARLTGAQSYGGATRHYHNLDHLVHGLTEIRAWAANTHQSPRDADLVRAAFWFHDAQYEHDATATVSNEEASAQLWLSSGLEPDAARAQEVATLIRVTDHLQGSTLAHRLKESMLGVDLAILGQDEEVYGHYARGIRAEYAHVPDEPYRQHRTRVLEHLRGKAAAGTLFTEPWFAEQYSEAAVVNMTRELALLGSE